MIWKFYLRWRHSKGFGVHSPYAYRLVKDVVRPGIYGYYAYHEISRHLNAREREDYRFIRRIEFAIRLMVFLEAGRIVALGKSYRLAEVAAKSLNLPLERAKEPSDFTFHKGDCIIVEDDGGEAKALKFLENALEHKLSVYAMSPSPQMKKMLEMPLSRGLLMNGVSSLILIPRDEMAYISYPLKM